MPTKNIATTEVVYQLKVTLVGTKPPIWRRLLVPPDLTLARLHGVLQTAMGWYDEHMHEFHAAGQGRVESEATVSLSAVLRKAGARITYIYDFGDNWKHDIKLEKKLPADPRLNHPLCTDGKLACPPEDCGGVHRYYALLDARAHPSHPRHKELCDWIGDFDPKAFSVDQVNRLLSTPP